MKKNKPSYSKLILLFLFLLCCNAKIFATHIIGADLKYTWLTGNTYQITFVAYGDCGSTAGCFPTLPTSVPQICIYDGNTYIASINLTIQAPTAGLEVTPVCLADTGYTQCHNIADTIPGLKKFVYTGTYTLPYSSPVWRFSYEAAMGPGCGAGRSYAITNIASGSAIALIDTLNNVTRHNSSPILSVEPTAYYCLGNYQCYNPGATDPDADSLNFMLIDAEVGTSGCSFGGTATYIAPYTGATPLATVPGTFSFDHFTGQLCFNPNAFQRSVVVYNIEEYTGDTLRGTSQREMTYVVIACSGSTPVGSIDSASGVGTLIDSFHYRICQNAGGLNLNFDPHETDTSVRIYCTWAGLPPGAVVTLTNNGTSHPHLVFNWSSVGVAPGNYIFSLHFVDNNCPIAANETYDYTIEVLPQPALTLTVIDTPSCLTNEVVYLTPGGTGSPWTITVANGTPLTTVQTFTAVTTGFYDTLLLTGAGIVNDTITIMTIDSTLCEVRIPLTIIPPPPFVPTDTFVSPPYCGSDNGYIIITNLAPGTLDTIRYRGNGIHEPIIVTTVDTLGNIPINGLLAGIYDSIIITYGNCKSTYLGPDTLINPPFRIGRITTIDPTRCGYCDGILTIHNIHPGQTDTLKIKINGVGQPPIIAAIATDSIITLTNLCPGIYDSIIVNTAGVCFSNVEGPVTLDSPKLIPQFTYSIAYGCHGDSVWFSNRSIDSVINFHSDSGLFYLWNFGDGITDTSRNPLHIYATGGNYHVVLFVNNLKCNDSISQNISLLATLHGAFTVTPDPVCQGRPLTFNNTSVASSPSYTWNFGDGSNLDTNTVPSHTYYNTGSYVVTLIATDFVPCHDTATQVMYVDSISGITMSVSDTVLCLGGNVTFSSVYSPIGNLGVKWTLGDGAVITNQNPIKYSYAGTGDVTVTVQAFYRACPDTSVSVTLRVYNYPSVYLGQDTAICPGGEAIYISDKINAENPAATWSWNTGETTPGKYVNAPGTYILTITIDGCQTIDTVVVYKDCYMDIPNIFTPNGDGTNDYFYPRQFLTKGVITFKMDIYNRWGQLIFETTSTDGRGWDGTFSNLAQPEGVYVYIIDATFKDGQIEHHQGNITLMR